MFSFISFNNLDSVLTEKDKKKKINSLGEKSVVRCVLICLFITFFSFLYCCCCFCCCCYCRVFFTWISFKLLFLFEIISFLGCVFFLPCLCYSPLNTIDLYCPVHCLLLFLVFLVESQLLFCEEVYCFCLLFLLFVFLLFSGPLFFEIFSRYICEFFYYYCYYSLLRYKNFTQFIIYLLKYYISLK